MRCADEFYSRHFHLVCNGLFVYSVDVFLAVIDFIFYSVTDLSNLIYIALILNAPFFL